MKNQQPTEEKCPYEIATKIAEDNFCSQKYTYIKEVLHHLNSIIEKNCEFTSEKTLKLVQALHESEAFRVRA